jgi:hypothetical protein
MNFGVVADSIVLRAFIMNTTHEVSDFKFHIIRFCLDTKTKYNDGYSRLGYAYSLSVVKTREYKPLYKEVHDFCVRFLLQLYPMLSFLDTASSPLKVENIHVAKPQMQQTTPRESRSDLDFFNALLQGTDTIEHSFDALDLSSEKRPITSSPAHKAVLEETTPVASSAEKHFGQSAVLVNCSIPAESQDESPTSVDKAGRPSETRLSLTETKEKKKMKQKIKVDISTSGAPSASTKHNDTVDDHPISSLCTFEKKLQNDFNDRMCKKFNIKNKARDENKSISRESINFYSSGETVIGNTIITESRVLRDGLPLSAYQLIRDEENEIRSQKRQLTSSSSVASSSGKQNLKKGKK